MRRVVPFAFAIVALLCAPAQAASNTAQAAAAPEWSLSFDDTGAEIRQERVFHAATREVEVDCRVRYEPAERLLKLEGSYRTTQALHPRAQLAYHLLAADGQMVRFDGARSDFAVGADGSRESHFKIEQPLGTIPGQRPALRVQFDYIVEYEFWYRGRFPELKLPELAVLCPTQKANFTVRWTWVPPLLPARTACWFPTRIGAVFRDEPVPYMAAMDIVVGRDQRIESPRLPLEMAGSGEKLVVYRMGDVPAGSVQIRPGFVWDGVEWFDRFMGNPYRKVLVVGPLVYAIGLTLISLGLWWVARRLSRVSVPWVRWSGYAVVLSLGLVLLGMTAVSCHLLAAAGLATIWWLQRRIGAPGPRVYWTTWVYLLLLELYLSQTDSRIGGLWTGTMLSICMAALVLLPLRWLRRPALAAWVGVGIAFVATLTAMAMTVYYDFFHDYPGLRDLQYVGQLGDAGASVAALIEQRHLVPWWWWLCSLAGLATMRFGGPANGEEP